MLSRACGRLASALRGTRAPTSAVARRCLRVLGSRPSADKSERTGESHRTFDSPLLEFLVCPLSKKPLRWVSFRGLPLRGGGRWPRGCLQRSGSLSGQSGYSPLPFYRGPPPPTHLLLWLEGREEAGGESSPRPARSNYQPTGMGRHWLCIRITGGLYFQCRFPGTTPPAPESEVWERGLSNTYFLRRTLSSSDLHLQPGLWNIEIQD